MKYKTIKFYLHFFVYHETKFHRILAAFYFDGSNPIATGCRNIRYINQALQSIRVNERPFLRRHFDEKG